MEGPLGFQCPRCALGLAAAWRPPGKGAEVDEKRVGERFPEFRFLEKIGRGGFGTVYRAEHRRLHRPAAVKLLAESLTCPEGAIARFEREMAAVGKLDHPGIVRAFDAGERDGQWFLAMEFVEGADLGAVCGALGQLPVAEACEIARQTALALQCAHEQGLVHRDVKPGNLMLGRSKDGVSVKVLDFGLATMTSMEGGELTFSGEFLGTVDYIAPELVENPRGADLHSDLYGLGATLCRLLTGEVPHPRADQHGTLFQRLMQVARNPVPSLSSRRADLPEGLATLVDRLLSRDPELRGASAGAVAAALEPFCQGADLAALLEQARPDGIRSWPEEGGTPEIFRPHRRARWPVLVLAGGAVAALAAGLVVWFSLPPPAAELIPSKEQFNRKDFVKRWGVPEGHVCRMLNAGTWYPWWGGRLTGSGWLAWTPGMPREPEEKMDTWLVMSRVGGVSAESYKPQKELPLAAIPRTFAFSGDGSLALWTDQATPDRLHVVPAKVYRTPQFIEAERYSLQLPPSIVVSTLVTPPQGWEGRPWISPRQVLVVDRGTSSGKDRAGGIHLCSLEKGAGIIGHWPTPPGDPPVDVAFGPAGIFLLVCPRERSNFTPVPADTSGRLFRREGDAWIPCTTDLPLPDPCALVADPRPAQKGALAVLCGHLHPETAPGTQRFLAKLVPAGADRYHVEIVADNFNAPAPGGLEISQDGNRLAVADIGAQVWYGWRKQTAPPGWD